MWAETRAVFSDHGGRNSEFALVGGEGGGGGGVIML